MPPPPPPQVTGFVLRPVPAGDVVTPSRRAVAERMEWLLGSQAPIHAVAARAPLDPVAARAYDRQHGLHGLFETLATDTMNARPLDPAAFLLGRVLGVIEERERARTSTFDAAAAHSLGSSSASTATAAHVSASAAPHHLLPPRQLVAIIRGHEVARPLGSSARSRAISDPHSASNYEAAVRLRDVFDTLATDALVAQPVDALVFLAARLLSTRTRISPPCRPVGRLVPSSRQARIRQCPRPATAA